MLINLTILYPATDAVEVNDIEHALNYRTITKAIIRHVEENRFALLERMTQEILDLVMENPAVRYAEVEVDKPHALRFAESVSITSPAIAEAGDGEPRDHAHKRCPAHAATLIIAGPGPVPSPCPSHRREHRHDRSQPHRTATPGLEAAAFRTLVHHLQTRKDVQNIDLMNLAGFCRNCLSKWYKAPPTTSGGSQQ
ncbi:D-erythro-7,8-dihydroneopterin triphosphate 2'-epimerase [Pseudomonas aeruginosa]|nr:D-erythro-7,8-dihydroneopterin triphosphate 2'-epimerase [Pseudomonas aeruginosa]